MRILRSYFHRVRSLFRRERLEHELRDELASHLEMHMADNRHAGMSPKQAPRDALLKLGASDAVYRCWSLFCRMCASACEC